MEKTKTQNLFVQIVVVRIIDKYVLTAHREMHTLNALNGIIFDTRYDVNVVCKIGTKDTNPLCGTQRSVQLPREEEASQSNRS